MAERRDTADGPMMGVASNGAWFALGPPESLAGQA
jgi:hypothetical protein